MKITQVELEFLINNTDKHQSVQVTFGSSSAWLKDLPENAWAIELVKAARELVKQQENDK